MLEGELTGENFRRGMELREFLMKRQREHEEEMRREFFDEPQNDWGGWCWEDIDIEEPKVNWQNEGF